MSVPTHPSNAHVSGAFNDLLETVRLNNTQLSKLVEEYCAQKGGGSPPASRSYNISKWRLGHSQLTWPSLELILTVLRSHDSYRCSLEGNPSAERLLLECFDERDLTADEIICDESLYRLSSGLDSPPSTPPPAIQGGLKYAASPEDAARVARALIVEAVQHAEARTARCGRVFRSDPIEKPKRWIWILGSAADMLPGLIADCIGWGLNVAHIVRGGRGRALDDVTRGIANISSGRGTYQRVTLPDEVPLPWAGILAPHRGLVTLRSLDTSGAPRSAEVECDKARLRRELSHVVELYRLANGAGIDVSPTEPQGESRFLEHVVGNNEQSSFWYAIPGFSQLFVTPSSNLFHWVNARRTDANRAPLDAGQLKRWREATRWAARHRGPVRQLCSFHVVRNFILDGRLPRSDNFVGSGIVVESVPFSIRYEFLLEVIRWMEDPMLDSGFQMAFEAETNPSAWLLKPESGHVYLVAPDKAALRPGRDVPQRAMLVRLFGGGDRVAVAPFRSLFEWRWNRARSSPGDELDFLKDLLNKLLTAAMIHANAGPDICAWLRDADTFEVLEWLEHSC